MIVLVLVPRHEVALIVNECFEDKSFSLKGLPLLFIALFKCLQWLQLNCAEFKAEVSICVCCSVQGQPTEWISPSVIRTFSAAHRTHNSGVSPFAGLLTHVGQERVKVFVATESK